jgi:hypothetical protein
MFGAAAGTTEATLAAICGAKAGATDVTAPAICAAKSGALVAAAAAISAAASGARSVAKAAISGADEAFSAESCSTVFTRVSTPISAASWMALFCVAFSFEPEAPALCNKAFVTILAADSC